MVGGLPELQLKFPAHAASVPSARHALRDWLLLIEHAQLTDEIELAVTEVVTNALVHAATEIQLEAWLEEDTIRVEVADGSSHRPLQREATSTSATGRGLGLLDQITTRWGSAPRLDGARGKVVWFEIGRLHVAPSSGAFGARNDLQGTVPGEFSAAVPALDTTDITITLLAVPLLLLSAWLEHTSSLVREHLLVELDGDEFETALVRHAAAGEALALLEEQWPQWLLPRDPDELLAAAVEPRVTAARMELVVPRHAVDSFSIFGEVIEDALRLADSGVLLTAPTQPEVRSMRRWLVSEVVEQAEGRAPRPHAFHVPAPLVLRPNLAWDASSVALATSPRLAADDSNCIIAASDSALEFLGHDHTLVGQRLLTIIPSRFHQAHLAGFSLHLVNGRDPLIGVPTLVPLLCADGTERMAEMLISTDRFGNGRSVYVADLQPA